MANPIEKARLKALAERINKTSKADFVKRLLDEKRKYIVDADGTKKTHKLGYVEEDGHAVVFPDVQSVGEELVEFAYPQSYERAVAAGDTVHMSVPDAELFTKNYKSFYPGFNKYDGGGRNTPRDNTRVASLVHQEEKMPETDKEILARHLANAEWDDGPIGFVPVLGDVLQGAQIIEDAKDRKWGKAAISAASLVLPAVVEKPVKALVRNSDAVKKAIEVLSRRAGREPVRDIPFIKTPSDADPKTEQMAAVQDAYHKVRNYILDPRREQVDINLETQARRAGFLKEDEPLIFAHPAEEPVTARITDSPLVLPPGSHGSFTPERNRIRIHPDHVFDDSPAHEFLHAMQVGYSPSTDIKLSKFLDTETGKFVEEYHRKLDAGEALSEAEKEQFEKYVDLFEKGRKFRQKKADLLLEPEDWAEHYEQMQYLSKPWETVAHPQGTAMYYGIKPYSDYPGDAEFDRLYKELTGLNGNLLHYRHETAKEKKRLWQAMTGTYLGLTGAALIDYPKEEKNYSSGGSVHIKSENMGKHLNRANGGMIERMAEVYGNDREAMLAMVKKFREKKK